MSCVSSPIHRAEKRWREGVPICIPPRHLSEAPLPITSSLSRYHLPEITYFILYYFLVIVSIVSFCPYNRSGWLHSSRRFAPPLSHTVPDRWVAFCPGCASRRSPMKSARTTHSSWSSTGTRLWTGIRSYDHALRRITPSRGDASTPLVLLYLLSLLPSRRPTAPQAFWDAPHSHVLGGRDKERGGTWFGVTTTGRIACLTNVSVPPVEVNESARRYGVPLSC